MSEASGSGGQGRGEIAGRVVDAHGRGIADAAVMLGGDSPAHPDIAALTDERGEFSFLGLTPGVYTVIVNAAGYRPQQADVRVGAGRVARLDVSLSP